MDKIIKLLNLSTSENDAECLSAIRMANSILKDRQILWNDYFASRQSNPYEIRQSQQQAPQEENIDEMLQFCLCCVQGDALEFIESLHAFYLSKGFLTVKQLIALKKFYQNAKK